MTAYEMRISDWSSDVCSSDLLADQRDKNIADDTFQCSDTHRDASDGGQNLLVLGFRFVRAPQCLLHSQADTQWPAQMPALRRRRQPPPAGKSRRNICS